jgi:long-chain acyl-CoA synthetase
MAGEVPIDAGDNVVSALIARLGRAPMSAAQGYRDGDAFKEVTVADFVATVRSIARGFVALGLEPGDKVCLFSATRKEFTWVDYAIWMAGCVTVPIYESDTADQVRWIVGNSGAKAIVCESAARRAEFEKVAHELPAVAHVFTIDEGGLDQLIATGRELDEARLEERIAGIRHDQLATLVYTSGTTGMPKGCMVSHGNFIWNVRQALSSMPELFVDDGRTLMFLPLAHIFARIVQVGCITQGVSMGYSTIPTIVDDMQAYKPTWVFAVPRVFEKIYNTAETKAGGGLKKKIFHQATQVAIAESKARRAGSVGTWLKLQHGLYDKLVYSKLKHTFGGELRFAISGGAPLGARLGHYFDGVGVLILEGYGLTETTAAMTANTPDNLKIGTVGRPMPGGSVRIGDDEEVQLKGGMIFSGYWQNDGATRATFTDDGWFRSGDQGSLDDDGFLRITGRLKELIVTAGGKNVQPSGLEDVIRANPLVSQAMVIGDAKPFIACLLTLDPEELSLWASRHNLNPGIGSELVPALKDDPTLRAELQKAIDDANATVSRAESIREFRILDQDLSVENGEMTATLKVKRKVVMDKYAEVIDDIYGSAGTSMAAM